MAELIAGVDEVGRGPLIGAVVTAAVILDPQRPIEGLRDSKRLTERRRQALDVEIRANALAWAIGRAEPNEIDDLNILHATMLAMRRAVLALDVQPDKVFIDGNRIPELPMYAVAVVGGDGSIAEISAASIIAKVARDAEMVALDAQYPQYGFARHKGYPTAEHRQALMEFGPLPAHRASFGPVKAALAAWR